MKKFIGLFMILGAIAIAVGDLLTFGNSNSTNTSHGSDLTTFLLLALAAVLFLTGTIKLIVDLSKINPEDQRLCRTEKIIRIIMALLLGLGVGAQVMLGSYAALITGLPYIILVFYLLFSRRYNLVFDSIILLIAIYIFFFSGGAFFTSYKATYYSYMPGFTMPQNSLAIGILFGLNPVVIFVTGLTIVLGDVLAKIKRPFIVNFRGLTMVFALIIFTGLALSLPYLYVPKIKMGQDSSGGTGGDGGSRFSAITNTSFIMSQGNGQYVYTAKMQNGSDDTTITNIFVDREKIALSPQNSNLSVQNSSIINNTISVPANQIAIIKISSDKPFYCVSLLENQFRYQSCYLE